VTGSMAVSPFSERDERLQEGIPAGLKKSLQGSMKRKGIGSKKGAYGFQNIRKGIQQGTQGIAVGQESIPDAVKGSFRYIKKSTKPGNVFKTAGKAAVNKRDKKMYAIGTVWNKDGIKKGMCCVTGGTLHGLYFNKPVPDTVLIQVYQMPAVAAIMYRHVFGRTAGRAGKVHSRRTG